MKHPDGTEVRAEVNFFENYSAPKTSPGLNPFATYAKDILSWGAKNTVID